MRELASEESYKNFREERRRCRAGGGERKSLGEFFFCYREQGMNEVREEN